MFKQRISVEFIAAGALTLGASVAEQASTTENNAASVPPGIIVSLTEGALI